MRIGKEVECVRNRGLCPGWKYWALRFVCVRRYGFKQGFW